MLDAVLLAKVHVGAPAVEGGAVDSRIASEGLDVTVPAGRNLAAQQSVHRSADAVLILNTLSDTDFHTRVADAAAADRPASPRKWVLSLPVRHPL